MAEEKQDKNLDRRTFFKLIGAASGTIAIAGITSVALGAGGGAAGIGGGGAAEGGYSNG